MATKNTLMIKHVRRDDVKPGYLNAAYKQRAMKRLERYLRKFPFDVTMDDVIGKCPSHIIRNANLARG